MMEWELIKFIGFLSFPSPKKIREIRPKCGDEFINIRIDGRNLINMIYNDGLLEACSIFLKSFK